MSYIYKMKDLNTTSVFCIESFFMLNLFNGHPHIVEELVILVLFKGDYKMNLQ